MRKKKRWNILNSIKYAAHLVFRKKYANTVSFITIKTLVSNLVLSLRRSNFLLFVNILAIPIYAYIFIISTKFENIFTTMLFLFFT